MAVFGHFESLNEGIPSNKPKDSEGLARKFMGLKETSENKLATRDVTNTYIRYHSKRGHFWFVLIS